ncbi:MAG: group III truncated hemoglobin [Campylobacterota bacterium]|nr:group III truncated hemoglobin [Campylobacterota bacterium]
MNNALYQSITEENIETLVRAFYPQVLDHTLLSPFFIERLGDDITNALWEEHLVLLTAFWRGVALGYEEYNGNPLQPHQDMTGLSPEAFKAWLSLFHKTVDTLYTPSTGQYFKDKSLDIAQNFMRRLKIS